MIAIADHLWQSTLFAMVAALLVFSFRKHGAAVRYWLWMAASLKFLVPFAFLVAVGSQVSLSRTAQPVRQDWPSVVERVTPPLYRVASPMESARRATPLNPDLTGALPLVLVTIWGLGLLATLGSFGRGWLQLRRAVRRATLVNHEGGLPILISNTLLEPGVFGVFRPCLVLPNGIMDRLTREQMTAILAHELCHVRRRDNLFAMLHMAVQAACWFYPLVWWIGARLVEERETACDEQVLRLGNKADVYAEGILTVCRFYLESPVMCASGVTGADLQKRIEAIMQNSVLQPLTGARKLLLSAAAAAAIALPVLVGVTHVPQAVAQIAPASAKTDLTFDVASVKPANPEARGTRFVMSPGGSLNITNASLRDIIALAYDVRNFQVTGGPGWLSSERFDIAAKIDSAESSPDPRRMSDSERNREAEQSRQRLRALLAERFHLAINRETKEMSAYTLTVAKGGPKIKEVVAAQEGPRGVRMQRGQLNVTSSPMDLLTRVLSNDMGRPVVDQTGLTGLYDFELKWVPEMSAGPGPGGAPGDAPAAASGDTTGPSIFTAVQEQLGLKLESHKAPVEMIVISRVERPSAN